MTRSSTIAAPVRPAAGSPTADGRVRGFSRGAIALLALVVAILAGLPQDRFAPAPSGHTVMAAHEAPGHAEAAMLSKVATADPDDGFDDAVRMIVPAAANVRPSTRIDDAVAVFDERFAPIRFERPPRTRL